LNEDLPEDERVDEPIEDEPVNEHFEDEELVVKRADVPAEV
jgi:hypothetical protein